MDALELFTGKHAVYARFIRLVLYPQGIEAFFRHAPSCAPDNASSTPDVGRGSSRSRFGTRARRGLTLGPIHAFDLTPAMIERFQRTLAVRRIEGVEIAEANVLALDNLPQCWRDYDLIVSASMLEYVARDRLPDALRGLRDRLADDGRFVLFITRRNWFTRPFIGRWWHSNLYTAGELRQAFREAGFDHIEFRRFPLAARYLAIWGHIVEALR